VDRWVESEVRRLIARALAPVMKGAEFGIQRPYEQFVRRIEGGRQELSIALVDYRPHFEFSFTLCVRLDAVEAIVNPFTTTPAYYDSTLTSMTQLEYFGLPACPARGVWYEVGSKTELEDALHGFRPVLEERILPFFDEYRDLAALNRGLNPKGMEHLTRWPASRASFCGTPHPYRAMTGFAIAHLTGDPRRQELLGAYRTQLLAIGDGVFLPPFERFVSSLMVSKHAELGAAPDPAT
jgi:hypothetical protein